MLVSNHQNSCLKRNLPRMSARMSPILLTGPHPTPHLMGRERLTYQPQNPNSRAKSGELHHDEVMFRKVVVGEIVPPDF